MLIDRCFVWSPAKYFLKGPALFQTVSTANSPDGSLEQTICRVRLRYSCNVWSVPVRRQTTGTLLGLWASGVQLFQEMFHIHHHVNISTTRVSSHSDYMYTRHLSETAVKREAVIQDRLSTFVIVKMFLIRYQHNLQLCLWQQIRTILTKYIETASKRDAAVRHNILTFVRGGLCVYVIDARCTVLHVAPFLKTSWSAAQIGHNPSKDL